MFDELLKICRYILNFPRKLQLAEVLSAGGPENYLVAFCIYEKRASFFAFTIYIKKCVDRDDKHMTSMKID